MAKKSWADMTPTQKKLVVVLGVLLLSARLRIVRPRHVRRPPSE